MKNRNKIKILFNIFSILTLVFFQARAFAQISSSTNYRLDDSEFDFGGGTSSSTNYQSRDGLTDVESGKSSSTIYQIFGSFFHEAFPGIPDPPTLTNTGGALYNSLDFVIGTGGNSSDTYYAIAISTDNFTTTNFVQADDTIGSTEAWQKFIDWGGASGQRLIYLTSNTTYKIKVKARYGPGSESGYSQTAAAATVSPIFSVTVNGTSTGTSIAGFTTNVTTNATTVSFTGLQPGSIKIGAQTITITTNATAGYSATIMQDHDLAHNNGATIPGVPGTNASPAAWPTGITGGRFGYHTTDSSLCIGTAGRFAAQDTFAAATSTPFEIACNTGPISGEQTSIILKVEVGSVQPAGLYQNLITYIATPQY